MKRKYNADMSDVKSVKKPRAGVGATRRESHPPIRWGRYCVSLLLFCLSAYGVANVDWRNIYDKVYQSANRPLANITIEGEFRFVSKSDLQALISAELVGRFVDLDLQAIKFAVEQNPWVDHVTIERMWPDSLLLKVVEQKPIARWNDEGFINHEGEFIKVVERTYLNDLPLLSGTERNVRELAKNYVSFSRILDANGLKLGSLVVDEQMSWTMGINDQFTLVLGRYDIQQKLQNFLYVYQSHLENKKHNIVKVDMRYEHGLAVSWSDDASSIAANR